MPPGAGDPDIDAAFGDRVAVAFSQLERSDFELLNPPDDLWDRIAASVAVEPECRPIGSGTVVQYSIDAHDVVFTDGDGWAEFARDNDAPELVELSPARTLWSYIDGEPLRDLWRVLIRDVRTRQVPATLVRDDAHTGTRRRGAHPVAARLRTTTYLGPVLGPTSGARGRDACGAVLQLVREGP